MSEYGPWVEINPTVVPMINEGFIVQLEFYDQAGILFRSLELMLGRDYTLNQWSILASLVKKLGGGRLGIVRYRIKKPNALQQLKRAIRQVPVVASSKKGARRPPVFS